MLSDRRVIVRNQFVLPGRVVTVGDRLEQRLPGFHHIVTDSGFHSSGYKLK